MRAQLLDLEEALNILRRRDEVIYAAYQAGMSKLEIFERTGIARTTIDRVLARVREAGQ